MRKWTIKLFSAFSGKSKEQTLKKKPFKENMIGGLKELHAYADKILGDEVLRSLFRTVLTRSIMSSCQPKQMARYSTMT